MEEASAAADQEEFEGFGIEERADSPPATAGGEDDSPGFGDGAAEEDDDGLDGFGDDVSEGFGGADEEE
jgi:hypothetical protein